MTHAFPFKNLNRSEFQYFVMKQKPEKKSTILRMSRPYILHKNNAAKLLTNW